MNSLGSSPIRPRIEYPSLDLPSSTIRVAAPPASAGCTPALIMLYNNDVRAVVGPVTACISMVTAVFPIFRDYFEVPTDLIKPNGEVGKWIPANYGTPDSRVPTVPEDLEHKLGLYHAACNIMVALFRDSRDNSHIKAAEGRFNAFKAGVNITALHVPYSPLDTAAFVTWISGQNWVHPALIKVLSTDITGPGLQLMTQLHMVARDGQLTTFTAINDLLSNADSGVLLIPGVIDEIPKFKQIWKDLETTVGSQWLPYMKATYHPEGKKISPNNFPKLASAAIFYAKATSTTMVGYRQGKPIPGGIPENKLREAHRIKIPRGGLTGLTEDHLKILKSIGLTQESIEHALKRKKRRDEDLEEEEESFV